MVSVQGNVCRWSVYIITSGLNMDGISNLRIQPLSVHLYMIYGVGTKGRGEGHTMKWLVTWILV